jgi:hypothetical protein
MKASLLAYDLRELHKKIRAKYGHIKGFLK